MWFRNELSSLAEVSLYDKHQLFRMTLNVVRIFQHQSKPVPLHSVSAAHTRALSQGQITQLSSASPLMNFDAKFRNVSVSRHASHHTIWHRIAIVPSSHQNCVLSPIKHVLSSESLKRFPHSVQTHATTRVFFCVCGFIRFLKQVSIIFSTQD